MALFDPPHRVLPDQAATRTHPFRDDHFTNDMMGHINSCPPMILDCGPSARMDCGGDTFDGSPINTPRVVPHEATEHNACRDGLASRSNSPRKRPQAPLSPSASSMSLASIDSACSAPILGANVPKGIPGLLQRRGSASGTSALMQRRRGSQTKQMLSLTMLRVNEAVGEKSEEGNFNACLAEKYTVFEALGSGSTSMVHHAVRTSDGTNVALKSLSSTDPEMTRNAFEEFELLQSFRHPSIIKAFDFQVIQNRAVIVMEYFPGRSLTVTVEGYDKGYIPEVTAQPLAKMLLQATDYLHQRRIVHRDIKPENVLIKRNLQDLRLVDFNASCCLRRCRALTPTGTCFYAAPEVVLGESASEPGDVWSVGLCIYFMLSGKLPQRRGKCRLQEAVEQPVSFSGHRWVHVSAPCKSLLKVCLALEKHGRPAPMILLEHEWMQASRNSIPKLGSHRRCRSGMMLSAGLSTAERTTAPSQSPARSPRKSRGSRASSESSMHSSMHSESGKLQGQSLVSTRNPSSASNFEARSSSAASKLFNPSTMIEIVVSQKGAQLGEQGVILVVNHADMTYKVRMQGGNISTVPADCVRVAEQEQRVATSS